MILKGNQRAGGSQLALHLLNVADNEHVTVHEMRGFVADDLHGALNESYAISLGTRCKQFLFSLSLNPPVSETVPIDAFEDAIDSVEEKLGLAGQPRAIVFHEKEGRRHAHCVWSRIDVNEMKAINLPHYKLKLRDVSRELYREYEWKMPRGFANSEERDPLNFTLAEWQQAKRIGVDPRKVKEAIQDAWAISDTASAFDYALRERGFRLAQGDRRGHVAIDMDGNIFAVSKAVGIKAKAVRAKLGQPEHLPTVQFTQNEITSAVAEKLKGFADAQSYRLNEVEQSFEADRRALVDRQRHTRQSLYDDQEVCRNAETKSRAERLPRGLKALWFRFTGTYRKIKLENVREATLSLLRDQTELANLVGAQLNERRQFKSQFQFEKKKHEDQLKELFQKIAACQSETGESSSESSSQTKRRQRTPKRSRAP